MAGICVNYGWKRAVQAAEAIVLGPRQASPRGVLFVPCGANA